MNVDFTSKEELQKQIDYGYSIVAKLFTLSDKELIVLMKDLLPQKYHDILDNTPTIIRTIHNEKSEKIEIFYYDKLIIEWFGIDYKTEHGTAKRIREFDKYFTLNLT